MNIYAKAAIKTVYMLATCLVAVLLIGLAVNFIPAEVLTYIGISLLLGFMIYIAYSINLTQLKYSEKLQEMNESIKSVKVDK